MVYTNGIEGKQSVWLRQLESANNVEIIPPSDDFYDGLALSPDGNFLYFARRPRPTGEARGIYRVSIFGGVPAKIISETEGWISISPDGAKISFVRCPYRDDEYCSLWLADSTDGKNERKLVSRPRPIRIGDNKISPDGKTIVFAVGQSANAANEFGLAEINLESGTERELTKEKFFNIKSLQWLPDKKSILLNVVWMPDRKNLAYISANREFDNNILWLQPLDAETPRQIATLGDEQMGDHSLSVSPDGKTFALVQGEWLHDAVLLKGLR